MVICDTCGFPARVVRPVRLMLPDGEDNVAGFGYSSADDWLPSLAYPIEWIAEGEWPGGWYVSKWQRSCLERCER